MTRIANVGLAVFASCVVAACNGKRTSPLESTAAASPPAAAAPAPTAVATAPVAAPKKKANPCPTLVAGATATAADTKDGIALRITATDDPAATEIRAESHAMSDAARSGASKGGGGGGGGGGGTGGGSGGGTGGGDGSGGGGGGGGGGGKCAVVTRNASLDVQDVPGGALVTMRPLQADGLERLRKQVRDRLGGGGP